MSVVAIPLLFGLIVSAGTASSPRSPVAMLPVAAERVTLEAVPRLEKLDDTLRRATAALGDVALLDEARTTENLAAVREMGITCEVDDVPCLAKVAVLVDVDRLLVPIVRIDGEQTALRLLVVDRQGGRAEASRTFTGGLVADEARALVREALAAPLARPTAVLTAPPVEAPSEPAPPPPPAPTTSTMPAVDGWWAGRVGLVAGGSAVALGAGIAAAVVDSQLETPEPWSEREGRLRLGQGLVALAVAGGVVGLAGGVLLAVAE